MTEQITKFINQDSLEITKNSRGYGFSVKIYGDEPAEIKEKAEHLLSIAKELTERENNGQK